MALPTKKQLKKHKRGARKALDTLDILDAMNDDSEVLITKKKSEDRQVKKPIAKKKKNSDIPEKTEEKAAKKKEKKKAKKKDPIVLENNSDDDPKEKVESEKSAVERKNIELQDDADIEPEKKIEVRELNTPIKNSAVEKQPSSKPEIKSPSVEKNPVEKVNEQIVETLDDEFDEDTLDDRYLLFSTMGEDYGIEIRYVTEIVVMQKITEVPDTPNYINGVINLRGKVIPVMDIRVRFSLEKKEYDDRTCIIVVCVDDVDLGFIVDTVQEVVDIKTENVDPPPRSHIGVENCFIRGMGKMGRKVKILLDVHEVIRKN